MSNNTQTRQSLSAMAEDEIDLRQLLDSLLQHRRLGFIVAACVLVIGLFYLFVATPIFKADALVQIEQQQLPIPGLQDITQALGSSTNTQADAEIQVMLSRSVIVPVVQQLHLDIAAEPHRFPLIGDALARRGLGGLLSHVGGHYAWDAERIDVSRLEVPASYHQAQDLPMILHAGRDGQYTLDDPDGKQILSGQVGQPAAATVDGGQVAIFVRALQAAPGTEFTITSHRVDAVVQDLQKRLTIAEKGKQTGVIGLSLTGRDPAQITDILNGVTNSYIRQNVEMHSEQASKSLQFLDQQLPDLQLQLTTAEAALQAYKSKKGAAVDLSVAGKAILDQATAVETQISDLKLQRSELKLRFTDASPPIKAMQQQLDQLEATKAQIETQLKALPQTELETIRLTRDVQVANDLYVQLLNKAQEYKVAKAGTVGDARIVDTAVQPWRKDQPKTALVLAATLVLAIFAGIGAIFIKVALRRTLETPESIEAQLGLPVFATVPHSNIEAEIRRKVLSGGTSPLLCREVPHEPAVESLRSLRTSLQFALLEAKNNIVAIHGPTPSIGKSFVAANLAFLLSDTEKSVLLIDADMRKGHVHKSLSKPRSPGLSEVITGSSKLEAAVHEFDGGRLKFLATGKLPPNPAELLTHGNFQALLQQVSKAFDFVVIDTPPTLNLADSISIGKLAGVNFLVVRGGVSTLQDVQIAQRRMDQNGIRVDGIIFNDLSALASKYGYGGYYSYKYKSEAA
ncbi:MAG: polysaccharide biosynthesis tyrosine autokinase [Stenotrophobium sp.]